jgi:hypothetical protein
MEHNSLSRKSFSIKWAFNAGWDKPMPDSVSRETVEAFNRADAVRDAATVAKFLDDDVVWAINGPVDHLPYCGKASAGWSFT